MNEKARERIEQKIKDIEYSMKHKHKYPNESRRRNPSRSEIPQIVDEMQKYTILQGIKYGLEKALEFIDEEESREEK